MGATVNDVLMSAVAGWTRRYLERKEEGGEALCERMPRVRANMAVSLVPKRLSDPIRFGVNISFVQVPLPVGHRGLTERVRSVRASVDWLKASAAPWIVYYIQYILWLLAGRKTLQDRLRAAADRTHMTVSNVAGPREAVSLCGQAVERLNFFVNPCNLATMVCIVSYAGRVSVGTLVDPAVVSDTGLYMRGVEEELEAIAAAG